MDWGLGTPDRYPRWAEKIRVGAEVMGHAQTIRLPPSKSLRPHSAHLYALSMSSIVLCLALWIRSKTIGEDERANAERRAIFVGLWPPMLWLLGDTLRRRETRGFSGLLRRR